MPNNVDIRLRGDARDMNRAVDQGDRRIRRFGSTVRRTGARIRRFGTDTTAAFRGIGTRLGGLGVGGLIGTAGLVIAGKKVIDFDRSLANLVIQAKKTIGAAGPLKEKIFDISTAARQFPEDIVQGLDAIVERTGNLDFAVEIMEDMALVATAANANMGDIGATASNLQQKFGLMAHEILPAFDILAAQGKVGSFTLEKMATHFERLLSSASAFGISGTKGLRGFGAFLQFAIRGTGTAEVATTATERVISNLLEKRNEIADLLGFEIVDVEASEKAGKFVFKNFDFVIKEIIRLSEGSIFTLKKIFGERAIRAIVPLAQAWEKAGRSFREYDRLVKEGGTGAAILEDVGKRALFASEKIKLMKIQLRKLQEAFMEKPIKDFADSLSYLSPELEKLMRLPFFDRSLWLGIGGAILGLVAGTGVLATSIITLGGALAGAGIAKQIEKKFGKKVLDEYIDKFISAPISIGGKSSGKSIVDLLVGKLPEPARPTQRVMTRIDFLENYIEKSRAPRNNGLRSFFPQGSQNIERGGISIPSPVNLNMEINISDAQVSVTSDKGIKPAVSVNRRGNLMGVVQ